MNERVDKLGKERPDKLLLRLSLPAVAAMMVHSFYHMVDTIFIGRGIGPSGIAASFIVLPFIILCFATSLMAGAGGASILSRSLGSGDINKADDTVANVLTACVITGVIFLCVGFLWGKKLLSLLGGSPDIVPLAWEYFRIVLVSFPFLCFSVGAENIARAEGRVSVTMFAMIMSSLINIFLDWLLIFRFGMGMSGAALATLIAELSMAALFLGYFLFGHSIAKRGLRIKIQPALLSRILAVGSASFVRPATGSIVVLIINSTLFRYGGDVSVASYGIINRTVMFSVMPMIGLAQGLQPILGYNYGAGMYKRALHVIYLSIGAATLFSVLGFLAFLLFPEWITRIFTNDPLLISETVFSIRVVAAAFFLVGFHIIVSILFQAIGKARISLFLTLSRQVIFLIPLLLLLPIYFQTTGVWLSFPLADLMAGIVSMLFFLPAVKDLKSRI